MERNCGWSGKILRVNVSDRSSTEMPTSTFSELFLGGVGIGYKIAWDEISPQCSALGAENKLIFSTGPLTGTLAPGSGRMEIVGKSPRTYPKEAVTRSGIGGHWGVELKHAGYDALILEGESDVPIYVMVERGQVSFHDASELWGDDTYVTQKKLKHEYGERSQVLCIGPAGENRCRFAVILTETSSVSGKSGFGAVMGAKKVKALVVKGIGGTIKIAHPEMLLKLSKEIRKRIGYNPAREWTMGKVPSPQQIRFFDKYRTGNASCYGCPVQCLAFVKVPGVDPCQMHCINYYYMAPAYEYYGTKPEADRASMEGAVIANKLGIDTFEIAGMIPWFRDLRDAGAVDDGEWGTTGKKIGSREFIQEFLEGIAYRKGIGNLLAEGCARAADSFPKGWKMYETYYPAHGQAEHNSVREFPGIALLWALDSRDPMIDHHAYRHLSVSRPSWPSPHTLSSENANRIAEKLFGTKLAIDHSTYEGKALAVFYCQNRSAVMNSLVLCDWLFPMFVSQSREDRMGDTAAENALLSAVTGLEIDEQSLFLTGERIWNLSRAIMVREGRRRDNDTIEESFFRTENCLSQDASSANKHGFGGVSDAGKAVPRKAFELSKTEYYQIRGWDPNTGIPRTSTLVRLGLADIVDNFSKY
jgi:aldehyde:ferredoxin oxidoreductase